jgi:short-subunit dehydrogenase
MTPTPSGAGPDRPWAFITGASSGIGKALAFEFASVGYNLFLTGRDAEALAAVARDSAQRHAVSTRTETADLARDPDVDRLIRALEGIPVEVLVNNAGFSVHGPFAETPITGNVELVDVQIRAALKLSRELVPGMIERGRGRILNVASVYSFAPVPFQSVYAASKAFLLSFSSALDSELREKGVTVTAFCPGVTQTRLRARAGIAEKNSGAGMRAEDAARIAVRETLKGTPVVVPGLANRMFALAARWLPVRTVPRMVRRIYRRRGLQSDRLT